MPGIRHELIIENSVEKIYHAITSQEGLSAWWTPDAKAKPERDSVSRFPFGPKYFKEMKIIELKPGDKVSLAKSHPELKGQIEQQRSDKGTLLIFHHDDWKKYTPMFAECNYTWGQFLRSLKLLCETGNGRPYPNQHRVES